MTAEDFRKARKILDMTQAELAEKIGVTTQAVQNWEYGKRKISKTTAAFVSSLVTTQQKKDTISGVFQRLGQQNAEAMTIDHMIQEKLSEQIKALEKELRSDFDKEIKEIHQSILTIFKSLMELSQESGNHNNTKKTN